MPQTATLLIGNVLQLECSGSRRASNTIRVARSRSSSGYFLEAGALDNASSTPPVFGSSGPSPEHRPESVGLRLRIEPVTTARLTSGSSQINEFGEHQCGAHDDRDPPVRKPLGDLRNEQKDDRGNHEIVANNAHHPHHAKHPQQHHRLVLSRLFRSSFLQVFHWGSKSHRLNAVEVRLIVQSCRSPRADELKGPRIIDPGPSSRFR